MKKFKSLLSALLVLMMLVSVFSGLGIVDTSAASYPKIPAFQISRVRQSSNDNIGLCY